MEKKEYETLELEIISFNSEDVITSSCGVGENDLPFVCNEVTQ